MSSIHFQKNLMKYFNYLICLLFICCSRPSDQCNEGNNLQEYENRYSNAEIYQKENEYLIKNINIAEYEYNKPTIKTQYKFFNVKDATLIHNQVGCFGTSKDFIVKNGINFYYMYPGDSYLILPFNMGELQSGFQTKDIIWVDEKYWTGKYFNKFINKDKSVLITLIYNDFDAWKNKYISYQDTLRLNYLKKLDLKSETFIIDKSNILLVEGKRKSKYLKQDQSIISKWIIKKDNRGMEYEMILYIDYLDTISEKMKKELMYIAEKFPGNPFE